MKSRPMIVAEISANHLGSLDIAKALVLAAHKSGADAVKFQTFNPDQMVGDKDYVIEKGPWSGQNLHRLYRYAQTPREWHKELFDTCRNLGLVPFSSPFSIDDVAFLESLDCPMYKIASFEITDLSLIKAVAMTGKHVILSTGMASIEEIADAVSTIETTAGHGDITLLRCTSAYPTELQDANLAGMTQLKYVFSKDVGLSDHTPGYIVPVVATSLGATIIEKHFTLSRAAGGPDSKFSMEPHEFREMVHHVEMASDILGEATFGVRRPEEASASLRRSLHWGRDIEPGTIIEPRHVKIARPATGLHPGQLYKVIGRTTNKKITAGEPIAWDHLSSP